MIIQSNSALINFCKLALKKKILYIDTEFDRRNTYFSRLSYISIYDGKKYTIIDALALKNLEPLSKVISNKKILKVLHGSEQDLEIFKNLKILTHPIFDTQIAAQFCGYEQPISYANAVLKVCKVSLDKNLQNYDWLKRPANKKIIEYLKNDVKYLKKLHIHFEKILKKNKNIKFFNEEMSNINIKSNILSTSLIRKKFNNRSISLNTFQELLKIRENFAKQKNIPKNWIFRDESILNIIKNNKYNNIIKNKNLSHNEKKEIIDKFKKIKLTKQKKIINQNIIKMINIVRSEISKKYKISEQLISNNNDTKIYLENFIKKRNLWREQIFYKITDRLIKYKLQVKIKNNNLIFN